MPRLPVPFRCLSRTVSIFCVVVLTGFLWQSLHAGGQPKTLPIHTVNASEIFHDYCAACHGVDGRGHGPAAQALKYKVPDLTEISKRGNGKFPLIRVREIIEGSETPVSHGSREMPVWGPVFHQVDADEDLGNVRTDNLAHYIESLQRK
jgi:mono/diheme cytochrome c family protein